MTNQKPPREFSVQPVRWTIMHPEKGGPLEVVSSNVYDSLASQLAAANAERDFCKAQWEMTEKRFTTRCDNLVEKLEAANAVIELLKHPEILYNQQDKEIAELRSWCAKLEAALERAVKHERERFHRDVCENSMGCHCKHYDDAEPTLTAYRAWRDEND